MLRAVFDHSARRFARKTTISRVGSSVQTCYQRTKTDNAGDQIPESIESHSGIHYRPPLVGFLSVEIQARLAVVYESKFVFDNIRSPMAFDYEWQDMPDSFGTEEQQRRTRGQFYAILKRIQAHKDFFERAWKIQVRCTALFDPTVEKTF